MNVIYVRPPQFFTTALFAAFKKQQALEAKNVFVQVFTNTKTTLSVNLCFGETNVSANYVPPGSESFRFHQDKHYRRKYFVITKKQRIKELEEHIKNIVIDYFKISPEQDFTITIWTDYLLKSIGAVLTPVEEEKQDLAKVG